MKEFHSNINIVGGGLVGSLAAHSLATLGYKISILEKNPIFNKHQYPDKRTTAISEGSKNFLKNVGVWRDLEKFCEPIKKIKVINRKLTNFLDFDNERRSSNLGYIVRNQNFMDVVYSKLRNNKNIKIFNNVNIRNFNLNSEKIITNCFGLKIVSDINLAADGKNSFVKGFFKTPRFYKDYKKNALVLTLSHSENHSGTAFEFFYKNGPLAILPMKKTNGEFCSSIVWTSSTQHIKDLVQMRNDTLALVLENETQSSVGKINQIYSKQVFPLNAHLNSKFFEERTIYIGDAAHSFHPIAGQGWNLGVSDIEKLFTLAEEYKKLGIDLGGNSFCKKYHNNTFYKAFRLYQITDKLDSFFKIQNIPTNFIRSLGITIINKNKKLKNLISDFAMGIN